MIRKIRNILLDILIIVIVAFLIWKFGGPVWDFIWGCIPSRG